MKSLQECKDEVAVKYGYPRFELIDFYAVDEALKTQHPPFAEEKLQDEAAELYAKQYKDEIQRLKEEKTKLIEALSRSKVVIYIGRHFIDGGSTLTKDEILKGMMTGIEEIDSILLTSLYGQPNNVPL